MSPAFQINAFIAETGPDAPTEAERALISAVARGDLCRLADLPPDPADPEAPRVRAALLHHLISGGSEAVPVSPAGVRLMGALIEGPLTLNFATSTGETDLRCCHFTDALQARRADLVQLVLSGSHLPDLMAEGLSVEGSLFMIGVTVTGRISLATASIGGQLALHGAKIGPLTAQGARVGASVYLRAMEGQPFQATGEVSFAGAEIGGQLACDGARIVNPGKIALNLQRARIAGDAFLRAQGSLPFQAEGEVHLSGTDIAGQLDLAGAVLTNPGGHAFFAPRLKVGAEFFWQTVTVSEGSVHLPSAHVGDLVDDLASWPPGGRTYLDGFTYDRITRDAPTDAPTRLTWLARTATRDGRFLPQPYAQVAGTLARMGHEAEARQIMAEQIRLKGRARRGDRWREGGTFALPANAFDWIFDRAAFLIVGYGYHPFRALVWLVALSLLTAYLALMAWNEGSMAPNSDLVVATPGWLEMQERDCLPVATPNCLQNPAETWSSTSAPGLDWESFHPLAYGVDVVIPVIELGQTGSWAPSKDRGPWGYRLWWARWVLIAAGWVVTALGAAAATGIIQRGTPT